MRKPDIRRCVFDVERASGGCGFQCRIFFVDVPDIGERGACRGGIGRSSASWDGYSGFDGGANGARRWFIGIWATFNSDRSSYFMSMRREY